MSRMGALIDAMIGFYTGDVKRINHFIKVYGFAKAIGEMEGLDKRTQEILETAAMVHDIGIKPSLQKYASAAGHYQEMEGPPLAKEMLERLGYDNALISRVCYLVSRHHTYTGVNGLDYQILLEADFLVNAHSDKMGGEAITAFQEKVFRTKTGIAFLERLYAL